MSTGATLIGSWSNNPVIIATNATEKMRITTDGYVGIGTTSPGYPLHIVSSVYFANGIQLHPGATGGSPGTFYPLISMRCEDGIIGREYWTPSDMRIKTNIIDINDNNALLTLRKMQPKTYEYVDKYKYGSYNVIGFIAQEIKEILPKAVTIGKDYIPNFYTNCKISKINDNSLLVSSEIDLFWNSLHDLSGNAYIDISGNACSDASGNKFFNIKLYDISSNEIICKTINIIDNKNFIIDVSGTKFLDASENIIINDEYLLYGQEVDDFNTLDKNAIFTVVTAAVQDIDKHQQEDALKISTLEAQVATLTSQIAILQEQMNTLLAKI
jgi:hypothetical protein